MLIGQDIPRVRFWLENQTNTIIAVIYQIYRNASYWYTLFKFLIVYTKLQNHHLPQTCLSYQKKKYTHRLPQLKSNPAERTVCQEMKRSRSLNTEGIPHCWMTSKLIYLSDSPGEKLTMIDIRIYYSMSHFPLAYFQIYPNIFIIYEFSDE